MSYRFNDIFQQDSNYNNCDDCNNWILSSELIELFHLTPLLVREAGLEPTRFLGQKLLRLPRLPVTPLPQRLLGIHSSDSR